LNEELAWVGRSVGPVRDLDVLLQILCLQLERGDISAGSRERILASLRGRRQALRQPLAECLHSERFRLLTEALADPALGAGEAAPAPPQFAGQTITALAARVRRTAARLADRPAAATLHRMRIRLKRLRYASEFFAPQVGPALAQEARRLVKLQDCLGAGQDAAATLAVLEELAAQAERLPPGDLLALGALMQVQREIRRQSAHRFQELNRKLPALLTRVERSVRRRPA
jgi:CHAD domain-containing protein